jgi:methylaspartate ammonia-lyase
MTRSVRESPRIAKVMAVPAVGAGYYEDLVALQADYVALPQRFTAPAVTPGFRAVREVAEGVSVGVALDTGQTAWGDCVAVSYSGTAGREPVLRTEGGLAGIWNVVAPALTGRALAGFRELAAEVDALREPVEVIRPASGIEPSHTEGVSRRTLLTVPARMLQAARGEEIATERVIVNRRLHPAIRYGVSQALLGRRLRPGM